MVLSPHFLVKNHTISQASRFVDKHFELNNLENAMLPIPMPRFVAIELGKKVGARGVEEKGKGGGKEGEVREGEGKINLIGIPCLSYSSQGLL